MTPALIIIMTITVILVGFILSRPFLQDPGSQNRGQKVDDREAQYHLLLMEIKSLEDKYLQDEMPPEIVTQLDGKKQQAAHLLRLINPHLE